MSNEGAEKQHIAKHGNNNTRAGLKKYIVLTNTGIS
jgi:hypothetical protein